MSFPLIWRAGRVFRLNTGLPVRFTVALTVLLGAALPAAHAQDAQTPPDADPPSRVAQLNYIDGPVTFESAGAADWAYAPLNRPLTTGDQLWVDANGRSELHIGSTALRLGAQTSLQFVELSDTLAQMKLTQGSFDIRVRAVAPGTVYEIDTPNLALQIATPGLYRVDVAADGSTSTVIVRVGAATAYGSDGSLALQAGQQVSFTGSNLQETQAGAAPALDSFDQWVAGRDQAEDNAVSARYVSREVPGYEDLDANGTWSNDPTYGEIWVPHVAQSGNWAPYQQGQWSWIAPWGWTWQDDAAWGFAPFHYGRWAHVGRSWAWVPGPRVAARQPVYSPALVAFVGGGGNNWNVNLAVGGAAAAGIAWFALAPGEAWRPAYRASPSYYNRLNVGNVRVTNATTTNNTTINNVYINRRIPGAVTAVPVNAFVQGRQVASIAQRLRPEQLAHLSVLNGAPPLAPVHASFMPNTRAAHEQPPQLVQARQVVATRAPVVPPALRDTLAQRNAQASGAGVAGAGEPVIRNETATPADARAVPADGGNRGIASVEGSSGPGRFQVVQAVKRPIARQMPEPQAHVPSPPSQRAISLDGARAQGQQPHMPVDGASQFNTARAQMPGPTAPRDQASRPQFAQVEAQRQQAAQVPVSRPQAAQIQAAQMQASRPLAAPSQQPAYSRPPAMHSEAPRYAAPVQHTEPPYHPPAPRTVNAPVMQRLEPRAQPQQPQRNEAPREAPRTQMAPHAAAPENRARAEPHSAANRPEGRSHEDRHG